MTSSRGRRFHAAHPEHFGTGDQVGQLVSLMALVVVPTALLPLAVRRSPVR